MTTSQDLFQVVRTDAYDRETVAEEMVVGWLDEMDAQTICEILWKSRHRGDSDWYVVRPQSAPLWRGMEEFV